MTFKDKSRRPAGKPADRGGKPQTRKPREEFAEKPARAPRAAKAEAPSGSEAVKPERISKLLARAGVASRRDIERMIMEGRVSVNGKVLDTPVLNATLADTIEVDGQPIRGIERTRLWLYHKPAGLVTTNSDPEGRPTVFDNLPEDLPRVMSIGRLDINTEGLLLLTNDGGLARVLELPTTGWLRRYRVRAHGEVDQPTLDALKEGIAVDGVLYGAIDATLDRKQGHNVWITMGLREGKNREIKNVLGALGLEVNRLIRISYGPFQLGDLPEAQVVEVRGRMLRDQLGPRLIEDAKANFDAPIYSHGAEVDEEDAPAKKPAREPKAEWARDDRPTDKKRAPQKDWSDKGDRRERALGRLDTRRDDAAKGSDKFGDKPKRATANTKGRTANVWMAPGARPLGEKAAAAAARRKPDPRAAKTESRYDDRPTSTVQITRARDEEGDWIRADGPDKKSGRDDKRGGFGDRGSRREGDDRGPRKDFGDRGPRRDFGDRGPRREDGDRGPRREGGDRAERAPRKDFGDRGPRKEYGDRPARDDRSERPRGERPAGDRPYGDKPRGDRPFGDKPRGRSFGEKSFGDRPAGDRPAGKPFGGKPGGKSFGGKPGGGKSFGGKPGGRSGGPSGGKSFGGKPGGGSGGRPAGGRGAPKGKR
ncbi:pseudouridine synthase [Peteryoungia ipomoeae]|uniref:Pseudouridine synthase n=1 Tax=Peteryoungia ipomoeae TaxID=1210932 RepID=A0A4S8P355_9HYPH|nr:pseudouridine synthase [Peteryoungia ipomoeae]THV23272.1 pseudouridine synthase [Peteryoungia ipomoeae]